MLLWWSYVVIGQQRMLQRNCHSYCCSWYGHINVLDLCDGLYLDHHLTTFSNTCRSHPASLLSRQSTQNQFFMFSPKPSKIEQKQIQSEFLKSHTRIVDPQRIESVLRINNNLNMQHHAVLNSSRETGSYKQGTVQWDDYANRGLDQNMLTVV